MSKIKRSKDHIYRNEKGEIFLSVTQHLQIAGLVDYSMVKPADLEFAALRGQYVHKAHYLYLLDDLEVGSLDKEYRGYCEAFVRFYKEQNIEVWDSENIVYSDDLRTAGTPDIICASFKSGDYAGAVIEIKTPTILPKTIGLQTAGYKCLYNEMPSKEVAVVGRWALLLKNNGKYSLIKQVNKRDQGAFRNIVHANWYALSNGIIPIGAKTDPKTWELCKSIINGG